MADKKVTKADRIKGRLEKFKKVHAALKNGNEIEVDEVLYSPSMKDGERESDLSSVERIVKDLSAKLEKAKLQAAAKGEPGAIGYAGGIEQAASRIFDKYSITAGDVKLIVGSGKCGMITSRDVRVFANAKANGTIEEYAERQLQRLGNRGDALNDALRVRAERIAEVDATDAPTPEPKPAAKKTTTRRKRRPKKKPAAKRLTTTTEPADAPPSPLA